MSCYGCKCNLCANSSELSGRYFTPGECDFFCYTCDECRHYDGDWSKRTMWRQECSKYKEPRQLQEDRANKAAARMRQQIHVIK